MIKYALTCEHDHSFESWFDGSEAYDKLRKRGLVECPVCGSTRVGKQIMTPAVQAKGRDVVAPEAPQEIPLVAGEDAKLRQALKELHAHVQANTEDVGSKFADEARKIHYGETEERAIRGRASFEEAKGLAEEGIGFHPLPPLPEDRN
jgi:hypothetical protein